MEASITSKENLKNFFTIFYQVFDINISIRLFLSFLIRSLDPPLTYPHPFSPSISCLSVSLCPLVLRVLLSATTTSGVPVSPTSTTTTTTTTLHRCYSAEFSSSIHKISFVYLVTYRTLPFASPHRLSSFYPRSRFVSQFRAFGLIFFDLQFVILSRSCAVTLQSQPYSLSSTTYLGKLARFSSVIGSCFWIQDARSERERKGGTYCNECGL